MAAALRTMRTSHERKDVLGFMAPAFWLCKDLPQLEILAVLEEELGS